VLEVTVTDEKSGTATISGINIKYYKEDLE